MESTNFLDDDNSSSCAGGGDGDYHYLDACFLCKRDITSTATSSCVSTGNAAFCSDDCRQDQMDMDSALAAVKRCHRTLQRSSRDRSSSSSSAPAAAQCTLSG
ncbi:hypothetical protein OsI_22391 [Oryza sativa Indica Group]|nr:hypothetical protein OsI_22391 [Oryza sativa Indica Group]BAD45983.1 hypothetical protein [Oryza sativa Japonica Group]